ncbi:MAG: hypothetical protein II685_01235 [Clostridia bacterium]|nr:hypothetical protein [Clostridia bacterium]
MANSTEKQIFKFAKPSLAYPIITAVFLVFCSIMVISMPDLLWVIIWTAFGVGVTVYCFWWSYLRCYIRLRNKLAKIKFENDFPALENDFLNGGTLFNKFDKTVIMGEKYMIAKQSGNIYAYSEIRRLYQEAESMNGVEMFRNIYIADENSKKILFQKIDRRTYSQEEWQIFCGFVESKNENVKFGMYSFSFESK